MSQREQTDRADVKALHLAADEHRKLRTLRDATAQQERDARTPTAKRTLATLRAATTAQKQTAHDATKAAVEAGCSYRRVAQATGTSPYWVWTLVTNDRKGQAK